MSAPAGSAAAVPVEDLAKLSRGELETRVHTLSAEVRRLQTLTRYQLQEAAKDLYADPMHGAPAGSVLVTDPLQAALESGELEPQ